MLQKIITNRKINFNIYINRILILPNDYNCILEELANRIFNSLLWSQLDYSVSLFIKESIALCLQCQVFESVREEVTRSRSLEQVDLELHYVTEKSVVSIDTLYGGFDYLLQSWLMSADRALPLVFSYYGRQMFKTNYKWIKKTVNEVFDEEISKLLQITQPQSKSEILMLNLEKLCKIRIHDEYNLINVLCELGADSRKRKGARDKKDTKPESDKSRCIKGSVYDLFIFRENLFANQSNLGKS